MTHLPRFRAVAGGRGAAPAGRSVRCPLSHGARREDSPLRPATCAAPPEPSRCVPVSLRGASDNSPSPRAHSARFRWLCICDQVGARTWGSDAH